ncbi:hypothetical protein [Caminibacter mediatlanticus]|uniref:Uncharacterized protein n=1 Tax=Caminibacter mediatlanticus TB-2 TaxID=391592 RepID=A0AAI9F1X7_9BACT|nr:hypothetical protein [Caminibacter mediatlanticus]EDM24167.1 hypothetical protein CMTB2_01588 [Caminibacter mediatlanticus TB-2]
MKEVFKYTFLTVAEWKKFLFVVLIISILTLIEPFPFIGITANIFEKLLYISIGVFLIYLVKNSNSPDNYFENLKRNGFGSFLFHYIPASSGILLGLFIIGTFWAIFFILILQFTNSMYIIASPHNIFLKITSSPFITQVLIGFYLIYLLFFSYIFLGKFGNSLTKTNFKDAFLTIVSSLIDFSYWVKTFNIKYFLIYLIWSFITSIIYFFTAIGFIFIIYPTILQNPNLSLILIPLLVSIYTILAYFTFFSSYFADKTTRN